MEFHQQQLGKHCRVCGRRLCKLKSKAPVYLCTEYSEDLLNLGVDVSGDVPTIHPLKFCNPCRAMFKRAEKARKAGVPYTHTTKPMEWTSHADSSCLVGFVDLYTNPHTQM